MAGPEEGNSEWYIHFDQGGGVDELTILQGEVLYDFQVPRLSEAFVSRMMDFAPETHSHAEIDFSKIGDGIDIIEVERFDVIVLSQSCDLGNDGGLVWVCVAPFEKLSEFAQVYLQEKALRKKRQNGDPPPKEIPAIGGNRKKEWAANLQKGREEGLHLLGKLDNDFRVVNFTESMGVYFSVVKQHLKRAKKRTQVTSPYREHLSQAYARFYMRVGLPTNINAEELQADVTKAAAKIG